MDILGEELVLRTEETKMDFYKRVTKGLPTSEVSHVYDVLHNLGHRIIEGEFKND